MTSSENIHGRKMHKDKICNIPPAKRENNLLLI